MNKNIITYAIVALMVMVPVVAFAQPTPAATPSSAPSLPTSDSTSNATPPTSGSSSNAVPVTPPTGGSSSNAVPVTPPAPVPVQPSGSSGGSSYSSGGSRVNMAYFLGCPLITTYMSYGANNDAAQVTKLQTFLKNIEKLDLDVTGVFDLKTQNAVKAFQNKYAETVLAPWGSNATGRVYITTQKQINKVACSIPLNLTPAELAIIKAYKNGGTQTAAVVVSVAKPVDAGSTSTDEVSAATGTDNTASVMKSSIFSRFWNFVKYLFK